MRLDPELVMLIAVVAGTFGLFMGTVLAVQIVRSLTPAGRFAALSVEMEAIMTRRKISDETPAYMLQAELRGRCVKLKAQLSRLGIATPPISLSDGDQGYMDWMKVIPELWAYAEDRRLRDARQISEQFIV